MMGRGRRADEVNGIVQAWTRAHDADEVVAACVAARVPATIVGNGAELPRFEQLVARDVFVQQPGEAWVRPRAPFRFHGVPDRALSAPAPAATPWPARRTARPSREPACGTATRGHQGARLHRLLGGSVRDRVAGRARCGRDQGRGRATPGRHPVQCCGPAAPRPVLLREVRAVPRVEPRQARHHPRSRPPRRSRARQTARGTHRRARRELHAACARTVRAGLRDRARPATRHRHAAHPRVRPHRPVAGPAWVRADDGTAHGYGLGDRLLRWPADHPRRPGRPDGGHPRRAGARRRARAPRPHRRRSVARGPAGRGRDRGDRGAGDSLLDRRHVARSPGRRRGVPVRR